VIYSHPQALAQCRGWLTKHFPDADLRETGSTAEAVESLLAKGGLIKPSQKAAIGRQELARKYKLRASRVPIDRENRTRFLVLSLQSPKKAKQSKTSLMFALPDKPGALYSALLPFKRHKINMTRIESRPSKQKAWAYVFFVDVVGHREDKAVRLALQSVARKTSSLEVLGSYPRSA